MSELIFIFNFCSIFSFIFHIHTRSISQNNNNSIRNVFLYYYFLLLYLFFSSIFIICFSVWFFFCLIFCWNFQLKLFFLGKNRESILLDNLVFFLHFGNWLNLNEVIFPFVLHMQPKSHCLAHTSVTRCHMFHCFHHINFYQEYWQKRISRSKPNNNNK